MTALALAELGDVAEFIRGITFKPDDVVPVGTPGAAACMRTKNVQAELDLSDVWGIPESFVRRDDQFLIPGDMLVSSANSWNLVGKCCWVPSLPWRSTFGGFVSVLRPNPAKVDPRYLFRWFASDRTQTTVRSFGQQTTNISNLNVERCLKLRLRLPPLPEQRRIAEILDKADALRAKRRAALAQLDTLTQSIFLDMFGDPATNPKGWPVAALKNCVAKIQIGPFGSLLHQEDYIGGGIPLVNPKHIQRGVIEIGGDETVTPEKYKELRVYHLAPGDVVMGRRGEMGRCAIVDAASCPLLCGTGSLFLRPDKTQTTSVFLRAMLSSEAIKSRLERLSLGQTLPNLNSRIVDGLEIPLPPVTVQRAFADRVTASKALGTLQQNSLTWLDALFTSLQHRAFRGEL